MSTPAAAPVTDPAPAAAAPVEAQSPTSPSAQPAETEDNHDVAETEVLPGHHWTQVPVESNDSDSAISAGIESTESLSSSILKYRTINGRRYHSEIGNAQYWGANDEGHNESLDILHHAFMLTMDGKLYKAPIKDPKKVLDIGTGTGIWAIDFADEFPGSEVIGTDISPIQPTWVPPNVKFEIEDCTQEWSFRENGFDFIHIRCVVGSIIDWTALYKEAYRCLKPGGWLETYESTPNLFSDDGTLSPKSALGQWGPIFVSASKKMGRSFTIVEDDIQGKAIKEAGFVNVQNTLFKSPTGGWPKDETLKTIGQLNQLVTVQDAEGFITFLADVIGWPKEQVATYSAHVRSELRAGNTHSYCKQRLVYGQKPLSE